MTDAAGPMKAEAFAEFVVAGGDTAEMSPTGIERRAVTDGAETVCSVFRKAVISYANGKSLDWVVCTR